MKQFSIRRLFLATAIAGCLLGLHFGTVSGLNTASKRAPYDLARYRGILFSVDHEDKTVSFATASYFAPGVVEVEVEVYGDMKAGCKQYYISVFGFCFLTPFRRDNWTAI